MNQIFFNCPRCKSELEISEEYIGVEIKCPYCEQTFAISAPEPPAPVMERKSQNKSKVSNENIVGIVNGIIALLGLVIAVGTFLLLFFFKDYEYTYYFKKDAEKATEEYWRVKLNQYSKSNYDIRENKKELMDSLKITDIEKKKDFVVVFYSLKFQRDTYNDVLVFKKNKDDYYVISSKYDIAEKYADWYNEINKEIIEHQKDGDKESVDALFE